TRSDSAFSYLLALIILLYNSSAIKIYTLSLHDALPIYAENYFRMKPLLKRFEEKRPEIVFEWKDPETEAEGWVVINSLRGGAAGDRKSTRLNSSHVKISYAVFCLKKKNNTKREINQKNS